MAKSLSTALNLWPIAFLEGIGGLLKWVCIGMGVLLLIGTVATVWAALMEKYHERRRRTVVDPDLGPMTFERGRWEIPVKLKRLGGEFLLSVDAPREAGPNESQRRFLKEWIEKLTEMQEGLRQSVQDAIFEAYRECYAEDDDSEYRPARPENIWRTLEAGEISLSDEKTRRRLGFDFGLSWHCTWDEEHGVAARFADGKFLDLCDQGEL
ncbi:MAG: DUF6985 domain-containing protein [Planctomycetota bacterium]|jgi:hypothetical protein